MSDQSCHHTPSGDASPVLTQGDAFSVKFCQYSMRLAFTELYCTTQFSMHWLVLNIEVLIWIKQLSSIMDGVYCYCQLISVMSEWWQIWTKEICLIYTRRLRGGLNRIWCSGKHHFLLRHIKNYLNRKKNHLWVAETALHCIIAMNFWFWFDVPNSNCDILCKPLYVWYRMRDWEVSIIREFGDSYQVLMSSKYGGTIKWLS